MKRGISIALQAAGMLLACLATLLNHPVIACGSTIQGRDTANYFNERGDTIFCDTKAAAPGNFVIRSCKTPEEIFPDWYGRDITKSSGDYQPADVHPITVSKARKVERLIRRGRVNDDLVRKNIVAILDKISLKRMLDTIKDSRGNTNSSTDFREYGGIINRDSSFTYRVGNVSDPCTPHNEGVTADPGGIGDFHSHPSGEKDSVNDEGKPIRCFFVQGPSLKDQQVVQGPSPGNQKILPKKRTGYVFGMREKFHLIYIYDSSGVKATLPFTYLLSQ